MPVPFENWSSLLKMAGVMDVEIADNSAASSDDEAATDSLEEEVTGSVQQNEEPVVRDVQVNLNARDEYSTFGDLVAVKLRALDPVLQSFIKEEILKTLYTATRAFRQEDLRFTDREPSPSLYESRLFETTPFSVQPIYNRQAPSAQPLYSFPQSPNVYSSPPQLAYNLVTQQQTQSVVLSYTPGPSFIPSPRSAAFTAPTSSFPGSCNYNPLPAINLQLSIQHGYQNSSFPAMPSHLDLIISQQCAPKPSLIPMPPQHNLNFPSSIYFPPPISPLRPNSISPSIIRRNLQPPTSG